MLGVKLDTDQQAILSAVQTERRISVRSGTARGKDFVAAVASICFLFLNVPSKVISTAPTGRQVHSIMLPEIRRLYKNTPFPLGGQLQLNGIKIHEDDTWYLLGFKSDDKATENWSGFHSPNLMVVVTEASGMADETFNAIEGILQGNSRLLLIFNPNHLSGEAYRSARSPQYKKFRLNCLNAPNVVQKKIVIPGQVDYDWVAEKIEKPGWVMPISANDVDSTKHDFEWEGKYYRPGNLFRVKVLGEFPEEDDDVLIPLSWIEAANERWHEMDKKKAIKQNPLRLGVDIAGMGRDNTIYSHRYGNLLNEITVSVNIGKKATIHMQNAGKVKNITETNPDSYAFIDTIGEGAGVYSRLAEQSVTNAISCKGSYHAKGLTDFTGQRKFTNLRAYMFWALRDALNPAFGIDLALPPDDELTQELNEHRYELTSDASIQIEAKDKIKERLGRSPDKADSVAMTYFPEKRIIEQTEDSLSKDELGIF